MAVAKATHRGHGEDSIYLDATKNRYVGAISLGFDGSVARERRKVRGKTKQKVRDKPKVLHAELDASLRAPEAARQSSQLDIAISAGPSKMLP